MTVMRLRPAHSVARLAELYPRPHRHTAFPDHRIRVAVTIEVARWLAEGEGPMRAADLSCGDGAVIHGLGASVAEWHLGDLAPGHRYTGPIEETIEQIPDVDLYVCTETIEHLDAPDVVLKAIRGKTRMLVVSTPVGAWNDDNDEHYWAWDRAGVEGMLAAAGFDPAVYAELDCRACVPGAYAFGVWGCR